MGLPPDPVPVLTIGYGHRGTDEFVALLQTHEVEYLVDVRSLPYSRRRPEFAREQLSRTVTGAGLRYLYLGDTLGGRPTDPACHDKDGHIDYERCRHHWAFQTGISRIETAARHGYRVALMCSEARPQNCHRAKLLAEMLTERDIKVVHVDSDGEPVDHSQIAADLRGPQLSLIGDGLGRSRQRARYPSLRAGPRSSGDRAPLS